MELIEQFLLAAALFIPLEHFFAHKPQKIFRRHCFNDCVFWFANIVFIGIPVILILTVSADAGKLYWPGLRESIASQPAWLQFCESMVLADFALYFAHRAVHAVPFLWRFHAVHHSPEELDWLVACRTHPVDQTFLKSASLVPVFLLGFSSAVVSSYLLFATWQTILTHSNVRLSFGPGLRWALAGPEFHRWHHAKNGAGCNKNFAGHFPIFDWVFGTAHLPKGGAPEKLGINEPMRQNYLRQLLLPFLIERPQLSSFGAGQGGAGAKLPARSCFESETL
jgi:sterol desaturase/sphingolipid hydroxylase (fatty acid hydroxylase superfamily)